MAIAAADRKRVATQLLLAGAGAAGLVVMPNVPHEHHVDLRLEDPASVTGVEVTWTAAGAAGSTEAPARGGTWRFEAGSAPATVAEGVRLPDGRYALDVVVRRGADEESSHRVITLGDADHITVRLR